MNNPATDSIWLQTVSFSENNLFHLSIGDLDIHLSHLSQEWQFHHHYLNRGETQQEDEILLEQINELNTENKVLSRFIHSADCKEMILKPRMANRSIVAKPHNPVFLPCNQSITIYVSTPIWVAFYINGFSFPLLELPTYCLSDTWFGPKPHIGELCYASRFSGRIDLTALPRRPSRIITPISISNLASDNLKLEKIAIPSEYLSVYLSQKGELWTPTLKVIREKEQKNTQVVIDKAVHPALQDAQRIAEPRIIDQSGLLSKTLDMLFS